MNTTKRLPGEHKMRPGVRADQGGRVGSPHPAIVIYVDGLDSVDPLKWPEVMRRYFGYPQVETKRTTQGDHSG